MTRPVVDAEGLIEALSRAPVLDASPSVVDVLREAPASPPAEVQTRVTGASGEAVYREAATFVRVAREWSEKHGSGLAGPALDFGSGWGRIIRFLLAHLPASSVYALDVDPAMTALTQATLPGVQSLTVDSIPPTALRDGLAGTVTAFSVFSHLAPTAHETWAAELARLLRADGLAFVTVLDEGFFAQGRQAQSPRDESPAARRVVRRVLGRKPPESGLAGLFADIDEAQRRYERGELVYAASGGGGVLDPGFYGWAAAPRPYIEETWGRAGFELLEWVPAGVLFPQAMVGLRRR